MPIPTPTEPHIEHEPCPFCQSMDTTTTSKAPDAESYWRCKECGQVWNAERLQSSGHRFGFVHHGYAR